jgi:hypothetical protein
VAREDLDDRWTRGSELASSCFNKAYVFLATSVREKVRATTQESNDGGNRGNDSGTLQEWHPTRKQRNSPGVRPPCCPL